MKHGSLISPDESAFGFGPSKIASATYDSAKFGDTSDAITIPDAQLLFNGEFKRAGDDLKIIGDDGKSFLVSDYFKNDKRPTLLSPEGAALTGDVVEALAGPLAPGQYAQAGTPQSAGQAIGRVEKVDGNASVVRNGVTITLNAGDVIQKGDVAQTGTGSSLAIVFSDGTAFNLASNARMVLNDFVYSAGGGNNSALISLVQGSISFVAGQVAKTGDMRVETPVATMGIRGTAVSVEISANNGQTKFSVMVEPNGTIGSFTLYDKATGAVLGTVNSSTIGWVVTPVGPLQVLAQQVQKSPGELAQELAIIQQVFQTFNAGQNNPFDPNAPQQPPADPDKRGDNPNPQQNAGGGTQIIPSDNGTITVTVTVPSSGGPTGTIPTPTNPNTPTVPGTPGLPGVPTGGTTTEITVIVAVPNQLLGIGNNAEMFGPFGTFDSFGTPIVYNFYTTEGIDWVFAGGGDDIIIAGHGGGDDRYDGGEGFETVVGDTIRYNSAVDGVIFNLNVETLSDVKYSTAQDPAGVTYIGRDVFYNIENIVGSQGDDIFILHDTAGWNIDGGSNLDDEVFDDFDIIKLANGLDIPVGTGPNVKNIEMIDLDDENGAINIVSIDGEGVAEFNELGTIRIVGNDGDIVNLVNENGENGHWVLVDGPRTGATLFPDDDHTDDVEFQEYEFIDDALGVIATAYVDTDITVHLGENDAPEIALTAATYLKFDDSGATTSNVLAQSQNVTLETWAKWDGKGTNNQILFYDGHTSFNGFGLLLTRVGGTMQISLLIGGVIILGSDDYLAANEWAHVALVRGTGDFKLYIDGELAHTWIYGAVATPNGAISFGGNAQNTNEDFSGALGEARLWAEVRDAAHIQDYMHQSFTGDEQGLAGYWPFNEGLGNTAFDLSGHARNLTIGGQADWINTGGEGWPRSGVALDEDGHITVRDISITDPDAGANDIVEVTLSVSHGTLTLADDSDIEVILTESGLKLTGSLADINAALAAGVVYTPDENFNGDDSISVTVNDQGNHGTGGAQTDTAEIDIRIAPVNDAPVISIEDAHTLEAGNTTTLSRLSVSDVDGRLGEEFEIAIHANHGTLQFVDDEVSPPAETLSFNDDLAAVNTILGHGVIYTQPAFDFQNPEYNDMVTLTVEDGHEGSDTLNFIFNNYNFDQDGGATLTATSGKDVLFGTGGADTFVFNHNVGPQGIGRDVVTDFAAVDKIQLLNFGYDDIGDISISYDNEAQTALITLGQNETIELQGVTQPPSSGNFIFS